MKQTVCDTCKASIEIDEFISEQKVNIHIHIESAKRDFPSGSFSEGDFCSVNCAIAWLQELSRRL